MQFMKGLVVAAAASLLVACGGGSPMDKAFAMGDKMISIIESNKTDLDKAAKELTEYLASKKDDLSKMKEEMEKFQQEAMKDPSKIEEMEKTMKAKGEALEARMKKLQEDVPAIKDHEGIKAAMGGLKHMF